jgi:hypothetical protein
MIRVNINDIVSELEIRPESHIFDFGIEQKWYQFKRGALKRIAIAWCEENDIPYVEDTGQPENA